MKRVILASAILFAFVFVSCKEKASSKIETSNMDMAAERDAQAKNLPVMSFDKMEHDFGTIVAGTPQKTTFSFTNTGNAPLIITNAKSSCGCTVPEYPQNTPIAPGESGELVVQFNGSGKNQVTKTVTVMANTEKGTETLRIKAFVNAGDGAPTALGPVK